MQPPMTVLMHLTIPRLLSDRFATPADVKGYLQQQGVWPLGMLTERWRLSTTVPGWEVDLEIHVPLPMPVPGGTP